MFKDIYHRIAYQQVFINKYTVANIMFIYTASLSLNSPNSKNGKIVKTSIIVAKFIPNNRH